jgi:hypothetical protein
VRSRDDDSSHRLGRLRSRAKCLGHRRSLAGGAGSSGGGAVAAATGATTRSSAFNPARAGLVSSENASAINSAAFASASSTSRFATSGSARTWCSVASSSSASTSATEVCWTSRSASARASSRSDRSSSSPCLLDSICRRPYNCSRSRGCARGRRSTTAPIPATSAQPPPTRSPAAQAGIALATAAPPATLNATRANSPATATAASAIASKSPRRSVGRRSDAATSISRRTKLESSRASWLTSAAVLCRPCVAFATRLLCLRADGRNVGAGSRAATAGCGRIGTFTRGSRMLVSISIDVSIKSETGRTHCTSTAGASAGGWPQSSSGAPAVSGRG